MKSGFIQHWAAGVLLCLTPFAALCQSDSSTPSDTAAAVQPATPVAPAAVEKPLPADIPASGPLAEMVKLANSGVDQSVLLAYVTNSTSTFNLTAEQIISLNDIGVPGPVVTAMLQHDQELKASLASAAAAAAAPAPEPAPAMAAPAEMAPPPVDYGSGPAAPVEAPLTPPEEPPSTAGFYDALSPYGAWVDIAGYGRCWQPTAVVLNPGWQPYFDGGHWVYTDCGWYWLSDYSWGWAPFHYGRWFRDLRFGWCWAPDTVWGPSWVSWRYSDDYCGWAPLPPGCAFSFGLGLTFHGHRVRDFDDCGLDRHHFRFVAWRDFDRHHLHDHALGGERVDRIFNHTVVVNRFDHQNNTIINRGIGVERVAAATHTQVPRVAIREVSGTRQVAGRTERLDPARRTLTVYHPSLQATRTGPALAERSGVPARPVRPVESVSPRATPGRPTMPSQTFDGSAIRPGSHERTVIEPVSPGSSLTFRRAEPDQPSVPNRPAPGIQPAPNRGTVLTWRGPNNPNETPRQWVNPTPWVNPWTATRPATPLSTQPQGTVTRSYQAPPARPAPVQVPQYGYAPPQRTYAPPPQSYAPPSRSYSAPSVPRGEAYQPAPSRPSMSEGPRYSAPPPAPSRPSGGESRPAPSAPAPSRSGGNSRH